MAKLIFKGITFLILLFFNSLIFANNSPIPVLQNVANKMVAYLQRHQSELKNNPQLINRIVDRELVPHIDANRMAGLVVGRQYWSNATPTQRKTFIREFEKMVTSTYSTALASYDGDQVQFYPLRDDTEGQKTVIVKSLITRRNGQRIPISYNLIRTKGQWKVYDFSIEGISLVQSYQSQFSGVLAQGGMSALLQRLIAHNRSTQ